ncbi:MAG: hypothetical protein ACRBCI_11565 [Cellvibrionaceae bacterium]
MEIIKINTSFEGKPLLLRFVCAFIILLISASCQSYDGESKTTLSETLSDISKERVAYAGFALMGSTESFSSRYKYSVSFEKSINKTLFESVRGLQPKYYNLITDKIIDADKGSSIALAFALEHEKILVEKISNFYKLSVSFTAQALVIDFDSSEGAIIASYPVILPQQTYVEIFEGRKPKDQEIANIVKQYFLGGLTHIDQSTQKEVAFGSLVKQFKAVIKNAPIKAKYAQEIGIGKVDFKEEVKKILPESYRNNTQDFGQALGQYLAARLSENQGVSVVPQNIDNSSAQMALRFTGSKSAQFLSLPKPDYLLNMNVRAIVSKVSKKTSISQLNSYLSVVKFTLNYNVGSESEAIFSRNFVDGHFKSIPKTMVFDDWYAKESSIYFLIDRFSKNIDNPKKNSGWASIQEFDRSDYKQLKKLNEVLEKCR